MTIRVSRRSIASNGRILAIEEEKLVDGLLVIQYQ